MLELLSLAVTLNDVDVSTASAKASKAPPTLATAPSSTLYQPTPLAAASPPPGCSQPATMVGQPVSGISCDAQPSCSSLYQPPVLVQPWGPAPVDIPFPMKMVAGDGAQQPDVLNEGFQGINLIPASVLLPSYAN